MCGIAGFWSSRVKESPEIVIWEMTNSLTHRGPDHAGIWIDRNAGLALGHRRLSVLDLSPAGHQPMESACGRYQMIFNGEIYNHTQLRRELDEKGQGANWRGHSDTETLLAAFANWGVEHTLKRLNGMFAIALWDRKTRTLSLSRDRLGEKPLYYGIQNNVFLFGSELKSLKKHPDWTGEINRNALGLYLRKRYFQAPHTVYRNVYQLPPAHWVDIVDPGNPRIIPIPYWDLPGIAKAGIQHRSSEDTADLSDALESHLHRAVGLRMEADVPIGAFLSGGYDSSTIVALMQAQSTQRVRTFSIGFEEAQFDEAPYARAVAKHLGTDHTELYVTGKQALEVVPLLPKIWDEPFGDSSQIPNYLVSKLTRESVTVCLSGDAGDEIFGGYNRHRSTPRTWSRIERIPIWARQFGSGMAGILAKNLSHVSNLLPITKGNVLSKASAKLERFHDVVKLPSYTELYQYKTTHWKTPEEIILNADPIIDEWSGLKSEEILDEIMYLDMVRYLPDDILVKADRASMAVSLEVRIPFLDPELVAFSWNLPTNMKIRNGQGKWLLRQVLHRYVPKKLVDRPKHGFSVPIEHWLRGPLKEWGENLLNEQRIMRDGFFNPKPIRRMWVEHQTGKKLWHKHLWDILMFQAWLDDVHKG